MYIVGRFEDTFKCQHVMNAVAFTSLATQLVDQQCITVHNN
jgi:hypothetical protein